MSLEERRAQAISAHQAGRFDEAERLYRVVLQAQGTDAELHHLLGILMLQTGRPALALRAITESLRHDPEQPVAQLNRGVALQQIGRPGEALAAIDEALSQQPDYADALNNRGDVLIQMGRYEEAKAALLRASCLAPDFTIALNNLGNAERALGNLDAARECYERAARMDPGFVIALNNLAGVLLDQQQPEPALAHLDAALAVAPAYAPALYNRGTAFLKLARPHDALVDFDALLRIDPRQGAALAHRGLALLDLRQPRDALRCFDAALEIEPRLAPALINRASAQLQLQQPADALASLERALEIDPEQPIALTMCVDTLVVLRRPDDALRLLDRALPANSTDTSLLLLRARVRMAAQRFEGALEDFGRILHSTPNHPEALFNAGMVAQRLRRHATAIGFFERLECLDPHYPYAAGALFFSRAQICDWRDFEARRRRLLTEIRDHPDAATPFALMCAAETAEQQLVCACANADARFPEVDILGAPPSVVLRERIKIAYVSGDFRNHAVSHLLVGVLEEHDRSRFEVIGVSLRAPQDDAFGRRVHEAFDRFIDVSRLSDQEAAAQVRRAEADIAIDLAGYTDGNRLGIFAHRAARIQANYLGYAGTLGAPYMDYLIADNSVIPEADVPWYRENIARLPGCFLPNDARRAIGPPPARVASGLPQAGMVFCAFTNPYKITPAMFDAWMRILTKVPGSVLWLRKTADEAEENLRREASQRGVDAGRLVFAPHVPAMADHLARQSLADLYLDTLPYNAHSTTCDALWCGVPVLTCEGTSFAGRVAASAVRAAGLPELVAGDLAQYESIAVELGNSVARLAELRTKLLSQRSTASLFDTQRSARGLEAAYEAMYARLLRGEAPASFAVGDSL